MRLSSILAFLSLLFVAADVVADALEWLGKRKAVRGSNHNTAHAKIIRLYFKAKAGKSQW